MKIYVIGSSLTSCYWNGAATYYRGIYKNLSHCGHQITFAEPDIYRRQQNRDCASIEYANIRIYQTPRELASILAEASATDLIVKHSGVGADDELLEAEVLNCRSPERRVAFWDVDAPATLARLSRNPTDPFRSLIPQYDFVFTYGGGISVCQAYLRLGAKNCFPIYNALDPDTHFPVAADPAFHCDLAFVGNRMPDREARVEQFFFQAAELAPRAKFLLGGEGWKGRSLPDNVRSIGHVGTANHNLINSSADFVLNINRESMAQVGFSPPTRVFEAAGSAACMITDAWPGIEQFFVPGREILVASSAEDIVDYLRTVRRPQARSLGLAMRQRALRHHTYQLRAHQVDQILRQFWHAKSGPATQSEDSPGQFAEVICEETH
ncbi:MAG: glycosyltransferase [Acidobacteria bacterium]|nr:glycosyltransferase [Acidobacteriota bacterium]